MLGWGCCRQAQQWIGREKEGDVASRQVGKIDGQLPDTVVDREERGAVARHSSRQVGKGEGLLPDTAVDRWGKGCCQTQQ